MRRRPRVKLRDAGVHADREHHCINVMKLQPMIPNHIVKYLLISFETCAAIFDHSRDSKWGLYVWDDESKSPRSEVSQINTPVNFNTVRTRST